MNKKKILIVGSINNFCLETSYASAAKELDYDVERFDPSMESKKYIRFGKPGQKLHSFIPVETWTRKMNRELIVFVKETQPDFIFLFANSKILYGSLITIRLIVPGCKLVWVWPDTPMNLDSNNLNNSGLIDLSATYSKSSINLFSQVGFQNIHWIALAGDKSMHWKPVNETDEFDCDLSFVGMWRPEREKAMKVINDNFPELKIEIHGNYWKRHCSDKKILSRLKGLGFYAKYLADYFSRSRINVNIIDDTNYPAANMRFFEIPTSGGLQLCSSCPEFENEFRNKESNIYFHNEEELVENIRWILNNKEKAQEIRMSAQQLINNKHNYKERLTRILNLLDK